MFATPEILDRHLVVSSSMDVQHILAKLSQDSMAGGVVSSDLAIVVMYSSRASWVSIGASVSVSRCLNR